MSKVFHFKNMLPSLMLALMSAALFSCSGDDDEKLDDGSSNTTDVAVTSNLSKLGITYAHIDGYVNLNLITSTYTSQQVGIELSMNEDFNNPRRAVSKGLEGNKLTVVIDTLSAQTKYFYRTFVKVNDLNYYGEKRSFTTKDFSNITSTGDASSLTFTSAKIDCKADAGSIDRDNNYAIGVAYSLSKSQLHPDSIPVYRKIVTCPIDSVKNKSYGISISRLQTGKTYYYCSFTRAGNKYKLGDIKSFSTKSLSATQLSTGDAIDVTFTSATIKNTSTIASMYPKNTSISYGVRYSLTKESLDEASIPDGFVYYGYDGYGNLYYNPNTGEHIYLDSGSYQTANAVVDGNNFTSQLRNLTSGTTYYYCALVSR